MNLSSSSATSSAARTSPASETPATTSSTGAPETSPRSAPASWPSGPPPAPSPGSSSTGPSERTVLLALGALLVAGAVLRIWGNDYGLPHTYHPDEGHIVNRAIRFHGGDLDPKFFNWPSLYMYLLSAIYGVVFGLRGVVESFSQDPVPFYLIGRTLTALMGTATIAVLYVLAAELYGATVGLLAGLFLTVNLLHIRDSHYITTDVPLTFLITVAMLFVFRYWRSGRSRDA